MTKFIFYVAVASIVMMVLAALAINDIYKGLEPDLSSEWIIVRISFILNCILGILVIIYFIRKKNQDK